jgi:hypothetical protein
VKTDPEWVATDLSVALDEVIRRLGWVMQSIWVVESLKELWVSL